MFEAMHRTLERTFSEKAAATSSTKRNTRSAAASPKATRASSPVAPPSIFISTWVDYTNKYGLGYTLTDGSVGMYFNDATTIIIASDQQSFEYIHSTKDPVRGQAVATRKSYHMQDYPAELQKKMLLMKYFRDYMAENLIKASYVQGGDEGPRKNLDFLTKYLRTKNGVMFRLSNRVLQINFFDHTKIIISEDATVVSYIDKKRQLSTYRLEDCFNGDEPELVSRLKYAKDILGELIERRTGSPASAKKQGVGK
ncbi:hypothetical protein BC938DRAFT_483021 [Jimgerdemannia flammicorona]|uniref:POLO box domain-containing protein n=1 Tax=Jimgerdemannia flammicorona TaxID=994334 RepID=A0A433QCR3_9FUNG|nr:hypothetical protein BC938DRAFT_483021 [Jimgerdemannia flammicorona]